MTLTKFLLARIAEDDTEARRSQALYGPGSSLYIAGNNPTRVMAECEAKRAIVAEHVDINGGYCQTCSDGYHGFDCEGGWEEPFPCTTLRALASVYADHPDYLEEWKP